MSLVLRACLLALPVLALQEVDAVARPFDELLSRYAGSGWSGSVLVARGGRPLLAAGYGFADFEADRSNDADTLFEIASITKSFTATAVVRLAQEKKLGLDDSIAVHLPGVPEHSRKITLRQLLSHTSGIPSRNADGKGEDLSLAVVEYLGAGPQSKPGSKCCSETMDLPLPVALQSKKKLLSTAPEGLSESRRIISSGVLKVRNVRRAPAPARELSDEGQP